ncbi:type I 3-dehydroquinate dehydratase [Sporolactobacillus shoreicorticis]|uniref:3-dehydroquinate dehydratase n=1 Tax=Sporolactobacillus shoreicorticis TaxID=1923877 RepID=A0ABW5S4V4_9BACL|nr:type I 3-dehydroquinate dehydratase [Sporolactobacillus shoreicorticis]MCO7126317.1 type I 3-dehydroquinate dehydratase [Sporolactobacillus shoreicorticis]
MNAVLLKKLTIGSGRQKICVPITATTKEEVVNSAEQILAGPVDFIEWRIDFMKNSSLTDLLNTAGQLQVVLGQIPLLVTFRSVNEGGKQSIGEEEYFQLYITLAKRRLADAFDLELSRPAETRRSLVNRLHEMGRKVIFSAHHFSDTPPESVIISTLKKMEAEDADIAKIAVMPCSPADVLVLMNATLKASEAMTVPVITMSMGALGKLSRISGSVTGSAVTFGSVDQASAPGQIEVGFLEQILNQLQTN